MLARNAAIAFDNLTLGYERHPAVHHLHGVVPAGALLAIAGPNGGGKSTLLKGIVGLVKPMGGRIDLAGVRARDVAYLPQQAEIDRSFPLTVHEMAAMGCWRRLGLFSGIGAEDREAVARALARVGLEGLEHRTLDTLSGGQLQRVLFARLLVQDAQVILLDEPFAAIDSRTCDDLTALIQAWHGEGRTVLAVLHDFTLVRKAFPDTLLLARETIAWGATEDVLTPAHLARARAMSEAWVEDADYCRRATA